MLGDDVFASPRFDGGGLFVGVGLVRVGDGVVCWEVTGG